MTGLYPESHGIVANEFFDPDTNKVFYLSNDTITRDHHWWHGEPVCYVHAIMDQVLEIDTIFFLDLAYGSTTGKTFWCHHVAWFQCQTSCS